LAIIESRLEQRIIVSSLAQDLSFSQSQLNKLFVQRYGFSVERYIRKRRMEEAEFYLTHHIQ
jgi:AraC-like DNA-binding protein